MVTRQIVKPADLNLDSPGRRDYWVALEHDTMWGAQLIPLTVWVGPNANPGRGLVAFGSTHGNEYEGPVAIKQLLGEIDLAAVTGRIILIPVLNVEAFRSGTRDSMEADRVNLNRAFVEGAGKQPTLAGITHRLAAFVRDFIWPCVHVVIDLHSGGNLIRFDMCAMFVGALKGHRNAMKSAGQGMPSKAASIYSTHPWSKHRVLRSFHCPYRAEIPSMYLSLGQRSQGDLALD